METAYDAIVVGGGPAGASTAILLAQAGWKVAVVEKTSFPRRKVCGEFISASTWPLLREMGVAEPLLAYAGPEVQHVGLYGGDIILSADMPFPRNGADRQGRALGREYLDSILLARAARVGADVWQPWKLTFLEKTATGYACKVVTKGASTELQTRIIIAAHGSWEPGTMLTQNRRYPPRASDLLGFKAHFRNGKLPPGLMPLLVFPGGYGGLVQTDSGRVSFSCCVRRDTLARSRRERHHLSAGEAVFAHVQQSCRGVVEALSCATLDATWLSTGPIRPGIRSIRQEGIFSVGNAAGEAHPIVAEGISMAIQSSWLLCQHLIAHRDITFSGSALALIGRNYERSWRENFALRIYAAALFAHLAMRPATAKLAVTLLKHAPAILTLGAQMSGKAQPLRSNK